MMIISNKSMIVNRGRYLAYFKDNTLGIVDLDRICLDEGLFPFGYDDMEWDDLGHRLVDWVELKTVLFWQPLPNPPNKIIIRKLNVMSNNTYVICRYNNISNKEEYLYKTKDNRFIFHVTPNMWFGSEEAAKNYLDHCCVMDSETLYIRQRDATIPVDFIPFGN